MLKAFHHSQPSLSVEFVVALERVVALAFSPALRAVPKMIEECEVANEHRGGDCKGPPTCHITTIGAFNGVAE